MLQTKVIPTLPELAFEIDDEGNPMFAGGKINFVERMIVSSLLFLRNYEEC